MQQPPFDNEPWRPPSNSPHGPSQRQGYNQPLQDSTVTNTPIPPPLDPAMSSRKPTRSQRWKASRKRTKVGIGCLSLFVLLVALYTWSSLTGTFAPHSHVTTSSTARRTNTRTPLTPVVQTHAPTLTPTHAPTPTPLPTQQPTATPIPIVYVQSTPIPTQAPAPTPVPTQPQGGVKGNIWGYNFTPGKLLYSPNPAMCSEGYFNCISTFWTNANGYVVECKDGEYSHSGGTHGACSRDGGVANILYSH
jgi:hypothetical protein